jgi:GNAT superfamily N-acetyltransferase
MTVRSLAELFAGCARGEFPAADGSVDVVGAPARLSAAVFSFSAHLVVAADVPAAAVHAVAPPNDFKAWGAVASWLAARVGREAFSGDVLLCARADGRAPALALEPVRGYEHPRVARASRYRDDVRVYVTADRAGLLVLGRGIGGRHELAFEVDPAARGAGLGRALVACALALVPAGEGVWAQVNPGNAASLRPVLAAGFAPVGYEQLIGTD